MTRVRKRRLAKLIPTIGAVALLASGCGLKATDIPIPGTYISGDTYTVRIEFGSVLNLPDKAKVIADGVEIGMLERIDLYGNTAVATVQLRQDAKLPKTTTAELRQSTILGDIHIALEAPKKSETGFLVDGDVIPVSQTVPATNVEDILRALSNIITGGRWADVQQLVVDINSAFPADPAELDRINAAGRAALSDMASHSDELNAILASAQQITGKLESGRAAMDTILTVGPDRAAGLSDVLFNVVKLIISGGGLARNAADLLVPHVGDFQTIVSVLAPTAVTVGYADITLAENLETFRTLLREKLIPFLTAPDVRVQRVSADIQADQLITTLRSIGMVP
ncbi:MlaD family protein [Nocardia huaxiensis]|uniref:MCE family protein n=1 Tax=Nocardia huaxiensis TaxID=2755382 RepID=A0A7D6ZGU3_9NOCA|nr:MlaD family protein [Nocardia huaxiensis]QLY27683.1 MCE family protein [Nocardia huaxiensis]UFS98928.1 MlaD family protein [Nocardia huaxiensis]